jgi:hypothetical protein
MKNILITAGMAVLILLTACRKQATSAKMLAHTRTEAATSQAVCYGILDTRKSTNAVFKVTEIWKGSNDGSTLGITNGTHIYSLFHTPADSPDGAILLFLQDATTAEPQRAMSAIWVRHGRVLDMTIQEFKKKIGL